MLTLMSIVVPLAVGLAALWLAKAKNLRNAYREPLRITWPEFGVVGLVTIGIAIVVTLLVGPNLARNSAIGGYHEFYNGSVTQPVVLTDECHRDGSCQHTYTCDHEEETVYDYNSKGEIVGSHIRDIYHQCPYVTHELSYVLETNIGRSITIAEGYFEAHPDEWRSGEGIPGDVPREPPERWLKAKADLEDGFSDPVTGVFEYENFILASDSDLYKEYEGSIENYQKDGLLPKHTAHLDESDMLFDYDMQAQKVQAVGGLKLANPGEWQNRLMRFNAALGSEFQGDMHIVLVPADKVSDPEDYVTALKAYWTSLGKWSISKNGIILAIGVSPDGETVEWSRAETGMPVGNGEMLTALGLDLEGEPFDPNTLLGDVSTTILEDEKDLEVVYNQGSGGAIGKIVFEEFPFARACMKCEDASDKGTGYVELKDLVPITTGAKIEMFFIVLFLSCILWGLALAFDPIGALTNPSRKENTNHYL